MPLNQDQIAQLDAAITGYAFPAVYFDFNNGLQITAQNMVDVEAVLNSQLRSQEVVSTKHGLANVLYWGYAQIGYRKNRVKDFMNNVSHQQILDFQALINGNNVPTMMEVKSICMPQYSGISFLSKILMFLNPSAYCVLDKRLTKLRTPGSPKILNELIYRQTETRIRITYHNEAVYNGWRNECSAISQLYFQDNYRAVDVERGFFNLIQQNHLIEAQAIYNDA
ncbi:MAG: hypothetical protein NT096_10970 [Proteobacteria bacterium]|nr:hypothetical protein [Pseudomonadota bacterium]